MKRLLMVAVVVATLAPLSAQAEHMTDSGYLAASRCLAYADHTALAGDAINVDGLRQAVDENTVRTHRLVVSRAQGDARDIQRRRATSPGAIEILREQRDAACARYVTQGLVQATTNASGG